MEKEGKRVLVYLRRDLRLTDNTALNAALKSGAKVIPVFVIDPRQVQKENVYRSEHALHFMKECVVAVDNSLKGQGSALSVLNGVPEEVLPAYAEKLHATAMYYNYDYTPFSGRRDALVEEAMRAAGSEVYGFHDALLTHPGTVMTKNGEPYKVFTPFHKAAMSVPVRSPETVAGTYFPASPELVNDLEKLTDLLPPHTNLAAQGGQAGLRERLTLLSNHINYETDRDRPDKDGTTLLSPYLKFGVISVREAYEAIGNALPKTHHALTRQLYWRDFFTHIAAAMPEVFGSAFKSEYDRVPWDYDEEKFMRWVRGTTGFPIVDAGMRQLKESGWMHNRVRMITASFLTKDLHHDWRKGEQYFATQLIDYDPAVNNGSWQWVAGTGADAQPWFRIFNPWLQQEKFDPEARYIKLWIPELSEVPVEDVHQWHAVSAKYQHTGYPAPMLNHKEEAAETLRRFKEALA